MLGVSEGLDDTLPMLLVEGLNEAVGECVVQLVTEEEGEEIPDTVPIPDTLGRGGEGEVVGV